MDFRQAFINSLHTNTALTKTISLHDYLPQTLADIPKGNLPYVQAYGIVTANFPYYYELSQLSSYCLLYSEFGVGTLMLENQSYELTTNTLLFIDCNKRHRIETKHSPWSYYVFFLHGELISNLYHQISENGVFHKLTSESITPSRLKMFYKHLNDNKNATLLNTKMILDLLLEFLLEIDRLNRKVMNVPSYLIKIKYNFENNYHKHYSLGILERDYQIGKFRICREFSEQYHCSPIQYLNRIRIEVAKENLIYTDKCINEIGRMVGIENTNLFIRLFKKQTGITPLKFRKSSPAIT